MPDTLRQMDYGACLPNLGLVSIAGNIDHSVCDVKVADLRLIRAKLEKNVLRLMREFRPHMVGLSCMSFQYRSALGLAKLIKDYDAEIKVVLGGYHPTAMYAEIAASPDSQFFDFIVRSEGEATFNGLIKALDQDSGYEAVEGLSFKRNGEFIHNPPRAPVNLDTLKLPMRDSRLFTRGFHIFGLPADVVETSRGCVYDCKFCSIKQMYGSIHRKFEVERVVADIEDARKHGAKAILIADDNITLDLKRLETLCDAIIAAELNSIHYLLQGDVKGIASGAGIARKMVEAGIKSVFLGVESPSESTLKFLGKETVTPEETQKAVKYLKDNNIIILGNYIVGNPDDNEESLMETAKTAKSLNLDVPTFLFLTPLPKTEIRKELETEGLITNPKDYSQYHGASASVRTRHLTTEELEAIVKRMYSLCYDNLSYLIKTQVRKTYPGFFRKLVLKDIPPTLIWMVIDYWKRLTGRGKPKTDDRELRTEN